MRRSKLLEDYSLWDALEHPLLDQDVNGGLVCAMSHTNASGIDIWHGAEPPAHSSSYRSIRAAVPQTEIRARVRRIDVHACTSRERPSSDRPNSGWLTGRPPRSLVERQIADSRYVRLPVSPARPPTICAGRVFSLRQVVGDVARPGVDLGPVAEVALREHRAGSRQLPDRPFRKPELARVQGSEEDAMALGPDGTL